MKTKLTVVIRENKELQQIDEIMPGPAFVTHAYKWLAPLHDMINMTDPKTKGAFKNFYHWYQTNDTVQTLGGALSAAEDAMNKMWRSGKIGKSNAIAMQSMIGLGDVAGATASSTVGAFMSAMRDNMEKEKQAKVAIAMEKIAKAEDEASAKVENEELKRTIRRMEMENAKKLFDLAKKLKEEERKTDDEKGERVTPPPQAQQKDAHVNEDKKMTKKYSSFKQQQTITENFRKFMNEDEYDQAAARGAGVIPPGEQAIIDFIRNVEDGTLEKNATVIVDIEGLTDEAAWEVLEDEGIFDATNNDERVRRGVAIERDIRTAIQNWINDRGLTPDGEIDYDAP